MLQNNKHPTFSLRRLPLQPRSLRPAQLIAGACFTLMWLSGCASTNISQPDRTPKAALTPPPVAVAAAPAAVTQAPVPAQLQGQLQGVNHVLAYADRVRTLSAADLAAEAASLANAASPAEQLQLSLALSQLHQPAELIRAQDVVARVLANEAPEARAIHPLARLLASRYAEQRRLEEQVDKQSQQLRDVQRKLDQSNERLEALKAIERSLSNRPLPPPPSPAASTPPKAAP